MDLSQYHRTLAHVTPRGRPHTLGCACTMRAYHHAEAPQAQVILPKLHHHAEELVPCRRLKNRCCVSAYRCRLVTPITQHLLFDEPLRVQATALVTSNNQAGSSELIRHRPNT